MVLKTLFGLLFFTLITSTTMAQMSLKKSQAQKEPHIQQQMIMLGAYIYGIRQESSQKIPNSDEMVFLSDSIANIAKQMKIAKKGIVYHRNADHLLKQAEKLKDASLKRDVSLIKHQSKELINACANCHRMGSL